jgi:hypothetical protein
MQFTDVRRNRVRKLSPGRGRNILYTILLTPAGIPRTPAPFILSMYPYQLFLYLRLLFCPKDGDSRFLQNSDNDLQNYIVSHARRQ